TGFHACNIDFRQLAGNQGAHAKHFSRPGISQGSGMARTAVESDFHFARVDDHQVFRWHAAADEMGAGWDNSYLFEPGQLPAQLGREHLIKLVSGFALQWWSIHVFYL